MAFYTDQEQAQADGFTIEHQADQQQFVVARRATSGAEGGEIDIVGHAHYSLRGEDVIDFDSTFVSPKFRGSGLAALLAQHALTHEIIGERRVQASCWYIDEYLTRNPQVIRAGG
jgi:predicted GNAT family acetyltransferase